MRPIERILILCFTVLPGAVFLSAVYAAEIIVSLGDGTLAAA